jgi:hypothetical protein
MGLVQIVRLQNLTGVVLASICYSVSIYLFDNFSGITFMPMQFAQLWNNYPDPDTYPHGKLFDSIGWGDLKDNPKYENTCAIRMSICLIKSGVKFPGRMAIKSGPFKGHLIEPGQVRLTNILALPTILGTPEKLTKENYESALKGKQGVVAFMRIPTYVVDGALSGHIDLIQHGTYLWFFDKLQCRDACYWSSQEFWFWSL